MSLTFLCRSFLSLSHSLAFLHHACMPLFCQFSASTQSASFWLLSFCIVCFCLLFSLFYWLLCCISFYPYICFFFFFFIFPFYFPVRSLPPPPPLFACNKAWSSLFDLPVCILMLYGVFALGSNF
jgi:hypothetical protein